MLIHTYNTNNYLELYNKWYVDKFCKNIPNDFIFVILMMNLAYWLMTEGKISNSKLYVKYETI